MSETKSDSVSHVERPASSKEQMLAFKKAYLMLMQLSTGEYGERARMEVDADTDRVKIVYFEKSDQTNAAAATVLFNLDGNEQYGWTQTYDEDLTHASKKLGSFAVTTDESGYEQDIYELYTDGNIEKIRFELGGTEDSEFGAEDRWTHTGWLTPQETERLADLIETGHFEGIQ